ncbi:DUF262 domain-containing protein [Gordonia sp. LSe1-13]|uniref:DUF262 domain-containing protein n=1 Tax=Gordonia sesuvii TaxID=3116777 RepID=A0ABU7M778_9ACTN|nr:DUF262 domain-containing protein [Gordonia sp. LSe1-13]
MAEVRAMTRQLDNLRRKVDVDNYTITVRELLSMADNEELHRAPTYQRKFRWDREAESRLIESILLGLPIPNLFFATNDDGTWEVVDGLQRVSTLIHFALATEKQLSGISRDEPLTLSGMAKLTEFNSLGFDDFPGPVRLAFLKRGIGVTSLSDKSDPETRFDTFERLNRGAVALSQQEVRACLYEGTFNELVRDLAEYSNFTSLVKLKSKDQNNATMEELVLKFFAYKENRDSFKGSVKDFLNEYMKLNRVLPADEIGAKEKLFKDAVDAVYAAVGNEYFLRKSTSVTPQNELEAVLVAASDVLEQHGSTSIPAEGWLDDDKLVTASTGATNTKRKLSERIERARELLTPQ